jgi:two-component sensor histidine kinase
LTLTIPHGFLVNDPEHAPFGASWLRGITPLRLAALLAVCVMFAARPTLWNLDPGDLSGGMRRLLKASTIYLLCALPLFVLVVKTEIRTARSAFRVRVAALALVVAVGALAFPAGTAAQRTLGGNFDPEKPQAWQSWHYMLAFYIRGLSTGGLLAAILLFAAHERDAQRRLHRARLARVEIEKQVTETRLRLLQAQIEPHFLFNSLASVKRLYEREPEKGRALLRNLTDYLRVATLHARQRDARLGDEIALARSFLAIFQARMHGRLHVHIDVPDSLESARVPPLMVGTLVENAIKHGIDPRASGGSVSLFAATQDGVLELGVRDDGVGFKERSGFGVGLANIRARLETLFAGEGSLELATNAEGGVTATIRLPHCCGAQGQGGR